jgi:hypothetical protein
MNRRHAIFEPINVEMALGEIDLFPAQTDEFGNAQPMSVSQQNHGVVSLLVTT